MSKLYYQKHGKSKIYSKNLNMINKVSSIKKPFYYSSRNSTNGNKTTLISRACLSSFLLVCVGSANAADIKVLPYSVGNYEVLARLDTSLGYSDNTFRGSFVEESSTFLTIDPTVQAVNETASRKITFDYEGQGAAFFENSDDGYISTKLGAEYLAKLSSVSDLSFGVIYEDGNSIRGTDILEGSNATVDGPTEFENKSFLSKYRYGGEKVGPTLELGFEYSDLEFQNFEAITEGRDRTLTDFTARIGYQVSVVTQFFVDLGYKEFDYDTAITGFAGDLDNDEKKIEVGVKWRATRQTTGEISVGVTDKDFDNFGDSDSITSWNAQVEWNATSRDVVVFSGFSRPFEQSGTGLFVDVEEFEIDWTHKLSPLWELKGSWATGSTDFEAFTRNDDYDRYELSVAYQPNRFSQLSLNYAREDKDSNDSTFDYEQNTVFLTYSTSL